MTREKNTGPRITDEKETVERMIRYYCKKKHGTSELCETCTELLQYAHRRLEYCQFGEDKPSCRKCAIHCYSPEKQQEIKRVMRYAGMRMFFKAPVTWLRHVIKDLTNSPKQVS